jgi:hypothetical protein
MKYSVLIYILFYVTCLRQDTGSRFGERPSDRPTAWDLIRGRTSSPLTTPTTVNDDTNVPPTRPVTPPATTGTTTPQPETPRTQPEIATSTPSSTAHTPPTPPVSEEDEDENEPTILPTTRPRSINIELPRWENPSSIPPNISPIANQTLRALHNCMKAVNQTNNVIKAATEAIAVCEANVTCSELGTQFQQTQNLVTIAAEEHNKATASVNKTLLAVDEVRRLLDESHADLNDKLSASIAVYCEEIVNIVEEQARLAAQATADASAKCKIILNISCVDCPRRPSNYSYVIHGDVQESNGTCESKHPIPQSFYVHGTGVIRLQVGKKYLSCEDGTVKLSTQSNSFWEPRIVGSRIVALKSTGSGTYLIIDEAGKVSCEGKSPCESYTNFYVVWSSGLCERTEANYIALRNINGLYLSVSEEKISSQRDVYSEHELFKGFSFEEPGC